MVNENQEPEYHNNNILGFLVGLLIGGLAGAVTMLYSLKIKTDAFLATGRAKNVIFHT